MRTRRSPWILCALAIAAVFFVAAPFIYKAARGGDDDPAAAVTAEGAEAATVDLDGTWTVVPGEPPNTTAAGYTVDEILRGEPVTVVGSTDQVTGEARIVDSSVKGATVGKPVNVTVLRAGERLIAHVRSHVMDRSGSRTAEPRARWREVWG